MEDIIKALELDKPFGQVLQEWREQVEKEKILTKKQYNYGRTEENK